MIDDLLARPQYGERWARHWLDVVRYAQSNGYERDGEKPMAWRYRDYVIKAFNEDKPYDRFVLEQLAGDELDTVTDDSVIATGFYRLGVWDDEPDDARMAEFDGLDDVMVTTGAAFMGLTLGCAAATITASIRFRKTITIGSCRSSATFAPTRIPSKTTTRRHSCRWATARRSPNASRKLAARPRRSRSSSRRRRMVKNVAAWSKRSTSSLGK